MAAAELRPGPLPVVTRCHQGQREGGSGARRSPGEDPQPWGDAGSALVWSWGRSARSCCFVWGSGGPAGAAGPAPFLLYLFLIAGEAGRNCRLCSLCRGGRIPAASPTSLRPRPGPTWKALRPWQDLAGAGSATRGPQGPLLGHTAVLGRPGPAPPWGLPAQRVHPGLGDGLPEKETLLLRVRVRR